MTEYISVLSRVTTAKGRHDLSAVFAASRKLKEALLHRVGEEVVIEQLTAEQFNEVVERARGIVINRDEVLIVAPDAPFLLSLARTYGTKADVHFTEAYAATYPDSVWPSYLWQQTDVTACTAFGTGELVARYSAWLSFRAAHPNAYQREVLAELREIESQVAESDCACGSRADVLAELDEFATAFPAAALRLAVDERIAAIGADKSTIRFNCSP